MVGTAVVPMVAPRLPSTVDETGQLLRKVWSNFLSEVSVVSLALKETSSVLVQWVYPFSKHANDANPVLLLAWLVVLGILGVAWDWF